MATRREFLKKFTKFSLSLVALNFLKCSFNSQKLPNIIIIFTDDQGYGDVGVYGAKGFQTPNLDRLAKEGMQFTQFYASQAVCSASRASLLTGCYAERVSIFGALAPWDQTGLNHDELTIAELLKGKGYATGMVGKWHLGHYKEFLPIHHGFDEYLGLPYSNDMWPVDYDGKPATKGIKSMYPPLPLIDGDSVVNYIKTLDDQATLTTRYTERALKFIEQNKDKPFFLYFAHSMPHVPLGVSDKFRGKSKQGMYGDVIEEIDWSVGEILKILDKYNLSDNTLIIYASDNGPWLNFGNHAGSTGGLREGKGTAFEGGPRVPCIMRWPGKIPAGSVCNKLSSTIDILPTIAEIVGYKLSNKTIDGVSILPLMMGDENANPRNIFYFYYMGELRAIREGKWKRVFKHRSRSYVGVEPGRDGFPGPYAFIEVEPALYNLEDDPYETKDLSAEYPDIVARLDSLAEIAREELGDRLTNRKGKGIRPPARKGFDRTIEVDNLAKGAVITLKNPPSVKYYGNGAQTLINGKFGSRDIHDLQWLGFEGSDLEATIDLKRVRYIKEVDAYFMQNQLSWIFYPKEVIAYYSIDGRNYIKLGEYSEFIKPEGKMGVKNFSFKISKKLRYIKVVAKNIRTCPKWHIGYGGKAWIFCDEIVIK